MSYKFNVFTGNFDLVSETTEETTLGFYTRFVCGKISDIEDGFDNFIDCCSLPITSTRQTIDLGTLDELCN